MCGQGQHAYDLHGATSASNSFLPSLHDHSDGLRAPKDAWRIQKGTYTPSEAYSALYDLQRSHSTGLSQALAAKNVTDVVLVGVATDYCVLHTGLDALEDGFRVLVPVDAVAGVTAQGAAHALGQLRARGATLVRAYSESFSGLPSLTAMLASASSVAARKERALRSEL